MPKSKHSSRKHFFRSPLTPLILGFCLVAVVWCTGVALLTVHTYQPQPSGDYFAPPAETREPIPEPNTSHLPHLTQAQKTIWDYTQELGIPFSTYPQSLIDLLALNPETEAFVKGFPSHEAKPIDLSQYDRSQGVPLFLQWDPQWGYETYGSNFLAITGCGPTCLAMAGYYLTGDTAFNPLEVARFAESNGFYSPGNGSMWSLIGEGGRMLGLDVNQASLSEQSLIRELESGNLIICVVGKGDFTTQGHFIVLTGYENGQFTVNDPNSPMRSQKTWSWETLMPQILNLWSVGRG